MKNLIMVAFMATLSMACSVSKPMSATYTGGFINNDNVITNVITNIGGGVVTNEISSDNSIISEDEKGYKVALESVLTSQNGLFVHISVGNHTYNVYKNYRHITGVIFGSYVIKKYVSIDTYLVNFDGEDIIFTIKKHYGPVMQGYNKKGDLVSILWHTMP